MSRAKKTGHFNLLTTVNCPGKKGWEGAEDVPVTATQPQPQLECDRIVAHNFISLASDGDKASLVRVDEDGHLFYVMKHEAWIGLQPKTDPKFGTLAFALYTAEACTSGTVRQVDFFNWKGKHVAKVGPGGVAVD